ncbi:S26 family signal peptidase [Alteromonas sp. 1_MG-2023]|uniref:S26 family signal peptidase n=1 Tax=Alteromonas sp. 1_MG-2023 TaxID=3062669 RepID=UPI0026E32479|nr:S26 family signal peptidase [Alteromonas sp. 1_MG-2023]MDO6565804.1 S26 family signal peptidase [Alteromonas sp. 1_MG-2023]
MLRLLAIEGNSMQPMLFAGDFILICKWPKAWLQIGHVLVVNSEQYGVIVKRVTQVCSVKGVMLQGDNALESVSTSAMGWIKPSAIIGKVIFTSSSRNQKLLMKNR